MELHALTYTSGTRKRKKRVGRGPSSGHGKTSCRGHKGAQSRSGYAKNPGFEGGQMPLHRRLPKRGFHHIKRIKMSIVNIELLEKYFDTGVTITAEDLIKKGLAKKERGGVKILGKGELTKPLNIIAQAVSPSAKQKIESAGGTITIKPIVEKNEEVATQNVR
ncbi:MAG TPA: 50S ribosomal protein L15 [Candidatus Hydrogenedens sp.]|nr:50S ribosomal protein L15 [Candidatus Hydrogenedens sp.]HOK10175.1 50S ribosomal protein L15 [Candidatus Hydrogenedens sp.]